MIVDREKESAKEIEPNQKLFSSVCFKCLCHIFSVNQHRCLPFKNWDVYTVWDVKHDQQC